MARSRLARLRPALGLLPFGVYLLIFLVVPTVTVAIGAFAERGRPSLTNLAGLGEPSVLTALLNSVLVSAVTALIGAVVGALAAYALVTGRPDGALRRLGTSICGVLAQFGGVTLAFAFIATLGISGVVSTWLDAHLGTGLTSSVWLFGLKGLILVYAFFQIPLMVIVFLPALDGIRVQWREAASSLGASDLAVLAPRRAAAAHPGVPRVAAAALRQQLRRVRHRGGPGQPGQPDHPAVDP